MIEYHNVIDKSQWPEGPYMNEPDKIQWIDKETDLDCLIVRSPFSGALCGYVGILPGHPYYEKHYGTLSWKDVNPHGGLTYSDFCQESDDPDPAKYICHLPEEGRVKDVWWFGFDCSHFMDFAPKIYMYDKELISFCMKDSEENSDENPLLHYRNVSYVMEEVRLLCAQLTEVNNRNWQSFARMTRSEFVRHMQEQNRRFNKNKTVLVDEHRRTDMEMDRQSPDILQIKRMLSPQNL